MSLRGSTGDPTHTIFVVPSASHATKGEAALGRAGVACALIPVPRTLSSQCGVCLRVDSSAREVAAEVLVAAQVRLDAIHDITIPRQKGEPR